MRELKIRVLEKQSIIFNRPSVSFIRGSQVTKEVALNYSNGTGQTLTAGQVLYTSGSSGILGFLEIKALTNYTLTGANVITLSITNYPTSTEANKAISFAIDGTTVNVDFYYNSAPLTNDIIIERANRTDYTFSSLDFVSNYSDYDGDPLAEIQLLGDLTGFTFNNNPIITGTWVSIADIANGSLKYTPLDQDAYYEKTINYKAKDINGNISID